MARRQLKVKKKKPLIIIASEGGKKSSEYYYFKNYSNRDLRIEFSTGNSTDPRGMLEDLKKFIINEDVKSEDYVRIFLVLDTDLNEERIKEIKSLEQECKEKNIEIITSAPTFEIWYVMHYRSKDLKFVTSKEVKREVGKLNGTYSESMNMFNIIKDQTDKARTIAKSCEKKGKDLLNLNPHTSVYKILDAIDEFNKLKD